MPRPFFSAMVFVMEGNEETDTLDTQYIPYLIEISSSTRRKKNDSLDNLNSTNATKHGFWLRSAKNTTLIYSNSPLAMYTLGPSLAPYIRSSRALKKWVTPVAQWYAALMGYRRMGLRYDDLQVEETSQVQRALARLTPREAYDRAYRMKLSLHQSMLHKDLPKDQWVPAEEDVRYLKPHIEEVLKEEAERAAWDTMTVQPK